MRSNREEPRAVSWRDFGLAAGAGLGEREAGIGRAIGRAADVIDAEPREKPERCRVAGVLTANPDPELGVGALAALDRHRHQLADSLLVQRNERVEVIKAGALVGGKERRRVV